MNLYMCKGYVTCNQSLVIPWLHQYADYIFIFVIYFSKALKYVIGTRKSVFVWLTFDLDLNICGVSILYQQYESEKDALVTVKW